MRILIVALVFASMLMAQRGGRGGGFRGGYGGHGFRGGFVHRPGGFVHRPGGFAGGGFYGRGGFAAGGFYGRGGFFGRGGFYGHGGFVRRGFYGGFGGYRSAAYGYWGGVPWYPIGYGYGGFYSYNPYGYGYPPVDMGPVVTVVTTPPAVTSPSTIVVNSYPRSPRSRAEDSRPEPSRDDEASVSAPRSVRPSIYLIAAKTGVISAATAYWVEGETLHFTTLQNERKQIPLAELDREFTEQLNRERNVSFRLR